MKIIRIATRGSKLALWQAHHISDLLRRQYSGLSVELNVIKTKGDIKCRSPRLYRHIFLD